MLEQKNISSILYKKFINYESKYFNPSLVNYNIFVNKISQIIIKNNSENKFPILNKSDIDKFENIDFNFNEKIKSIIDYIFILNLINYEQFYVENEVCLKKENIFKLFESGYFSVSKINLFQVHYQKLKNNKLNDFKKKMDNLEIKYPHFKYLLLINLGKYLEKKNYKRPSDFLNFSDTKNISIKDIFKNINELLSYIDKLTNEEWLLESNNSKYKLEYKFIEHRIVFTIINVLKNYNYNLTNYEVINLLPSNFNINLLLNYNLVTKKKKKLDKKYNLENNDLIIELSIITNKLLDELYYKFFFEKYTKLDFLERLKLLKNEEKIKIIGYNFF